MEGLGESGSFSFSFSSGCRGSFGRKGMRE